MTAFVLLFALQVIAAPALCTIRDRTATSPGTSDRAWQDEPRQAGPAAGLSQLPDARAAGQSRHGDTNPDRCAAPVLLQADTQPSFSDTSSIAVDLAPSWCRARLQSALSAGAVPARRASLAPPPAQSSTLDIAPRLRI